ncbi:unnamed protein product [Porites evermanni]|uniref:Uncharacterized protein n=1 Tax=Porites evermanni TaxID=104178 RepID=A0ABN8L9M4_9CNID|nr:unnamed protein product [Porites evermanni]
MRNQNTNHLFSEETCKKLNRYFMEGQNTDGAWKDEEKLVEFIWFWLRGAKQSESYSDVRMYETSVALDPVAAFEFYLCKTQPDCKSLFQSPSKDTTKNINFANPREGYRNEPVWGKYHQQDDGTDFHQSRVASTVTSLFQRGERSLRFDGARLSNQLWKFKAMGHKLKDVKEIMPQGGPTIHILK